MKRTFEKDDVSCKISDSMNAVHNAQNRSHIIPKSMDDNLLKIFNALLYSAEIKH